MVHKVLASAVANARNNEQLDPDDLYVSACYADEGTTLKRWRPRARGRATRIRKRTCHITVIVSRLPEDRLERRRARQSAATSGLRSRRVAASRRGEDGRAVPDAEEPSDTVSVTDAGVEDLDTGEVEGSDVEAEVVEDDLDTGDTEDSDVDTGEAGEGLSTGEAAGAEADEEEAEVDEEVVEEAPPAPRPRRRAVPARAPTRPPGTTTVTPALRAKRRRAEPWARRSTPTGSASA